MTDMDRELERLLRDPLTRRRLFRRGGAAAFGLSALGYLAACGPKTGGVSESAGEGPDTIAEDKISDSLTFSNWPLYIEEDRGTLKEFQEE